MPPFSPSSITFHCPPLLLPGSLALLLGSSLLPFCLSSGRQVDKQVLSGLLPSLGDWLPFRTCWGGWLLGAGAPSQGRQRLLLLPCILGPTLCLFCPGNAPPCSADLTFFLTTVLTLPVSCITGQQHVSWVSVSIM